MKEHVKLNDRLGQQKAARSANQSSFLGKEIDSIRDLVGPRRPFCYLNYEGYRRSSLEEDNYFYAVKLYGHRVADALYSGTEYVKRKRPFASYTKVIAHLTALKLAACEEEGEYKGIKPCQIVEGYYTQSGKEVVEKTWSVTDECISLGRDNTSSGQSSEQRAADVSVPKNLGINPYIQHRYYSPQPSRGSGTATGSSSTTTMDPIWNVKLVSDFYGSTTTSSL